MNIVTHGPIGPGHTLNVENGDLIEEPPVYYEVLDNIHPLLQ